MARLRGMLLLAALALPAHADGKFFSTAAAVVETPDQRAILQYADGRERLVIDTSFVGEGEDFAWIVPLPSAPDTVEPVSPGVFRTLEVLVQPRVVARARSWWPFLLVLFGVVVAATLADRFARRRALRLLLFVAIGVLGLMAAGIFLMPLGAALAPTVLAQGEAGAFAYAAVSADRPADVLAWLRDNGYRVAPESEAALADYVREGWVFVAGRLRADGPRRPHPIAFTFAAPRAVYPLRLTGAGQGRMRLDLYVFADRRARSDRLEAVYCGAVRRDAEEHGREDVLPLHHAGLTAIAGDTGTVTKLSGVLEPAAMREDLLLDWAAPVPLRATVYTAGAARTKAANAAAIVLFVAFFIFLLRRTRSPLPWLGSVVAAALLAVAVHGTLDVREARWVPFGYDLALHRDLALSVMGGRDVMAGRRHAARVLEDAVNPFTGGRVIEEDSPGNYLIREVDGRAAYVWFDATGSEVGLDWALVEPPDPPGLVRGAPFDSLTYSPFGTAPESWRYRVTAGEAVYEVRLTGWVPARREFAGRGVHDSYAQVHDDGRQAAAYFEIGGDVFLARFRMGEMDERYAPPAMLLPLAGRVGDSWSWAGTLNGQSSTARFEALAFVEMDTPAGRRTCLHVRQTAGGTVTDRWYAKGVGLVCLSRSVDNAETLRLELVGLAYGAR